ncbi:MAG: hypothetical protein JWL76_173 [Thermoleophilia bacterium]|nr:hypothetical protein [Thermoleophilia bacterium]
MSSTALDVTVRRASDGAAITLRDAIGGQASLIVLMRHLDCPFCEVYVGRVLQARDTIGRIVLVGNATPEELREVHQGLPPEVLVVADETQAVYEAWRTGRLRRMLDLRIRLRSAPTFVRHLLRGGRLSRPGQDLLLLGGDVVVDADGTTTWLRTSRRPDDRPDVAELDLRLQHAA